MVKRTLIALAVVALLVSSAYALGPEPHRSGSAIKIDKSQGETVYWPFEYKALDLCTIPVKMEIGYFVEVKECNKKEIKLKQVDCADLLKNPGSAWPCYQDCEEVTIRANFAVKLGLKFSKIGKVIDKYDAYIKGDVDVVGPGEDTIEVCVEAWQAKLWESGAEAGTTEKVGELTITVKPAV